MIKLLIETNVEINLRSIEEFTRVIASERLEDKILFDIQKEVNLIENQECSFTSAVFKSISGKAKY